MVSAKELENEVKGAASQETPAEDMEKKPGSKTEETPDGLAQEEKSDAGAQEGRQPEAGSEPEEDGTEQEKDVPDGDEEPDAEAEEAKGADANAASEKKGFFKKKEKKDKKDEKIEELNDRLMRTMAEFDNFRKRSEREKSQMFEIGAKDIVEKILPVVDNFERGLSTLSEEEKEGAFAQGMEKVYKQLLTTLETAGVTPIEAVGKEFNPDFHNAVMHIEDENFGENIVAEEFQKGYMYRESVVRHSMVKVAN